MLNPSFSIFNRSLPAPHTSGSGPVDRQVGEVHEPAKLNFPCPYTDCFFPALDLVELEPLVVNFGGPLIASLAQPMHFSYFMDGLLPRVGSRNFSTSQTLGRLPSLKVTTKPQRF